MPACHREMMLISLGNALKKQDPEGKVSFHSCSFPENSLLMFLITETHSGGIISKGSNGNMPQNI